ncbi:UNVERIFIED_CONTAM: hypothetical protein K2H54_022478 [Gekko kuhli]
MSLRKRMPLKPVEMNFDENPTWESLEAKEKSQNLRALTRTAKNAFGTVSQKIHKSCQGPTQTLVNALAKASMTGDGGPTKTRRSSPRTPRRKSNRLAAVSTPTSSTKMVPKSDQRQFDCDLELISTGIRQLKRLSHAFNDIIVQEESASRKPDKTAKSPHKPTARPTKEKKKPGKGTTGTSDAPSGPPEPKRPRKTTPVPTTVSSASVRPSDSTSAPARPSDSEILTVEDPRYRHSDPELPPTDDRRSPAAHLSDIMLVPSRSPSLCSQPPSELFESDDARAPVYPDRQDWYRDTENVASFYGSRSRSRHPSLRYSPEARSPSPNTYARYYYASRYRPYPRPRSPPRYRDPWDRTVPPPQPRAPQPRAPRTPSRTPASASLGAPPVLHQGPSEQIDPPLYMPDDLTRADESSPESDDNPSNHSDSDKEDTGPSPLDSDLGQQGSLSPSDGPKSYLQLISRILATGIALRRHAWLRTAHLPDDIKAKVEDLPFDGEGLFHTTTDQYLTSIDDSRKTAKRLGFFSATPSKPKQRTWTPRYQRRHNSPRSTDSWKGRKTYPKPTHQPKGRNQKPKRPDDSTKQSL